MSGYLLALALTVAVETPLYALALRLLGDRRPGRYAVAAAVNVSSHPIAWFVAYRGTAGSFLLAEVFAVAWEAGWLWTWLRREQLVLAAVALVTNGLSLALGTLL